MSVLAERLTHWREFTVVVVGDYMLDQIVFGDADRLTADAPVPVLSVHRTEDRAGGSANVCLDLMALRGRVIAIGVVGDDAEGRVLRGALERGGVDSTGLVVDPTRPTTVKKSLVGLAQHRHPQKMFRLDHESREPISRAMEDLLLARFDAALAKADVVAIEDYHKGVCTERVCQEVIRRAKGAGKEVLIDPASMEDYGKYRGCTAVTPNRTEAERATRVRARNGGSDEDLDAWMAHDLASTLECDAVVLTLDKQGALLLEHGHAPRRVPTMARAVYDVTGAGDMVLAALCAARANRLCWAESVEFANAAAGLEVEVFGVQPIPLERIHQSILSMARGHGDKRRTLAEAMVEVSAARREGKAVVFANGCFDVIHAGHIALVRRAAAFGDLLVVGLNSDDSVRRLKGPDRPVHGVDDRVEVLSELESVDVIVVFEEDTPERVLEALRPDVLVKGGDYAKSEVVGGSFVESYGGRVELVDLLVGRSSTRAIERLGASR
jgi:D-beta-D-heptose 7-phosphate kinase/D-beta-D-heptose 1-phosphate adenosyltransferase